MDKKLHYQYVLLQCGYYAVSVCYIAYIVPVLQKQGFNNVEIGLLLGIRALFTVIFQPVFADLMDKYDQKVSFNQLIALMIVVSMFLTLIQLLNPSFPWMLLIFSFYGIFTFGMISFIDAMSTLYFHIGKNVNYPVARGAGSFSYAAASLLIGLLANPQVILITQFILFLPLLLLILKIEKIGGIEITARDTAVAKLSFWQLMKKYPLFAIFLVAIVFSFVGKEMSANFLIDVYRSLGGSSKSYGVGMFILAASEVFTALIFTKLADKLGLYRLMLTSFTVAAVRILLILLAPNLFVLNLVQVLQMFGNGLFWAGNVQFIRMILPANYAVKGQAAVGVCYLGIGSGLGSVLGGWLLEQTNLIVLNTAAFSLSLIGLAVLGFGAGFLEHTSKNAIKTSSVNWRFVLRLKASFTGHSLKGFLKGFPFAPLLLTDP